jgi:hypothetical protein
MEIVSQFGMKILNLSIPRVISFKQTLSKELLQMSTYELTTIIYDI